MAMARFCLGFALIFCAFCLPSFGHNSSLQFDPRHGNFSNEKDNPESFSLSPLSPPLSPPQTIIVSSRTPFNSTREVEVEHLERKSKSAQIREIRHSSSSPSSSSSCATGNPIDDCWRCDPHWELNRQHLADCSIGFGRETKGGKGGKLYIVTDSSDDDTVNPRRGTLRWGAIQSKPLWIIFAHGMTITLKQELIVNSFKTLDGRGANVHIAHGACITVQYVSHVIIHGVHIHDCVRTGPAMVRSSPTHYGWRTVADGDGISIFGSKNIWIDHCSLAHCADGLIDAVMGSTAITISNNYFTHHDKVMLLGHSDAYIADKSMQVTIAYNHFGEGLVQRMPRCRHGYFEIVNNDYTHWEMYAIGGSADPTINSQGNRYTAPFNRFAKQVTMRIDSTHGQWKRWAWRSTGDMFLNGAYFTPSGSDLASFQKSESIGHKSSSLVGTITANAGAFSCRSHSFC